MHTGSVIIVVSYSPVASHSTILVMGCEKKLECVFYPDHCGVPERHHKFWTRAAYKALGRTAMRFREHPDNIDIVMPCEHRIIHLTQLPPPIPTLEYMENWLAEKKKQ